MLTADYERMCRDASKIANGDQLSLRIGYLRCYSGSEFHRALDEFSGQDTLTSPSPSNTATMRSCTPMLRTG